MARVAITGASGCIGSWVARQLLDEGHEVVGLDLATESATAALLGIEDAFETRELDVRDAERFRSVVRELAPDALVHLVSMLMPACRAAPEACVDVNVRSFMTVLELAREASFHVAYASSAWVLNAPPGTRVEREEDWIDPQSLYGVFKLANEGMSRMYAKDHGVASNGLRPYIVYGPGRERGLTADINLALLAAARGEPFEIGFGGDVALQHASDVARTFARLALEPPARGEVYNLRGHVRSMDEVVAAIREAAGGDAPITWSGDPLPIAADLDDARLQRDLGPLEALPLERGFRETIAVYDAAGRLA